MFIDCTASLCIENEHHMRMYVVLVLLYVFHTQYTRIYINTLAVRILYFLYKRQKTTHVLDFHIFRPKKIGTIKKRTPTASNPHTWRTVPPKSGKSLASRMLYIIHWVTACAIKWFITKSIFIFLFF